MNTAPSFSEAMNKPVAVKAIHFLALFQIAWIALIILFVLYAASADPQPDTFTFGFRTGFLQGLGYDPVTFGAREAGTVIGSLFLNTVLAGLILLFVRTRRLLSIRIVAVLEAFFRLGIG